MTDALVIFAITTFLQVLREDIILLYPGKTLELIMSKFLFI